MHFPRVKLFTKKSKQAGPLVFQLAPHHWIPTPIPDGPPPRRTYRPAPTPALSISTSASTARHYYTPAPVTPPPHTRTHTRTPTRTRTDSRDKTPVYDPPLVHGASNDFWGK